MVKIISTLLFNARFPQNYGSQVKPEFFSLYIAITHASVPYGSHG
jgi:hypothetical protein